MEDVSRQLRALGLLLDYPCADVQAHLAELMDVLGPLSVAATDGTEHESLRALLSEMAGTELLDLQAQFVDTFDRGRSTSLNLFEQVHGDSRDRGQAMVDLLAQYQAVGLRLQGRELPDYLPIYLEYASVLPPSAAREALQEVLPLLANLAFALGRRESPWLAAVAALCTLAGAANWRTVLEQEGVQQERGAHPQPHDAAAGGLPADWTPEGLDAAWAEEPVSFLGACSPKQPGVSAQPMQFVARSTKPHSSGVRHHEP
ncbi:nitrate reductase molybdenum cofactor assembly chaperone [Thiomonas sp. FB-Cd]|uniref:nitrate reductase molybdenum cofactor assembly chaperone n=1 Tax=Thiomonas sp. FB-Cd TaxID=1158292 RepID=UPI0004DEED30|nr:nitrate reductase molybdenum cofactor assembly chaperone [Thiomonas sp. FB-Cd]